MINTVHEQRLGPPRRDDNIKVGGGIARVYRLYTSMRKLTRQSDQQTLPLNDPYPPSKPRNGTDYETSLVVGPTRAAFDATTTVVTTVAEVVQQ